MEPTDMRVPGEHCKGCWADDRKGDPIRYVCMEGTMCCVNCPVIETVPETVLPHIGPEAARILMQKQQFQGALDPNAEAAAVRRRVKREAEALRDALMGPVAAVADSAGGGVKADTGKPPVSLISRSAVLAEARVLDFGAKKYAAHNWRKGMKWSRLVDAMLRHALAYADGEDLDPETGLSHLAHLRCCAGFLIEYAERGLGEDDRYKRPA
jgi:Domain of unknown function (DUF5664)